MARLCQDASSMVCVKRRPSSVSPDMLASSTDAAMAQERPEGIHEHRPPTSAHLHWIMCIACHTTCKIFQRNVWRRHCSKLHKDTFSPSSCDTTHKNCQMGCSIPKVKTCSASGWMGLMLNWHFRKNSLLTLGQRFCYAPQAYTGKGSKLQWGLYTCAVVHFFVGYRY